MGGRAWRGADAGSRGAVVRSRQRDCGLSRRGVTRRFSVLAFALAVSCALLGGCTSTGEVGPSSAAAASRSPSAPLPSVASSTPALPTAPGASQQVGPSVDPSATGVAEPLPNPVRTVAKVRRPGYSGQPTVPVPTVGFPTAAAYPDGVRLVVSRATKGIEHGHGPGVHDGREYVRFELRLTNGTSTRLDLNQVVVTTFYGPTRQLAPPVYTEGTDARDFTGTVAPGDSADGVYVFAVPSTELRDVTMVVDFDGPHASAVYHGAVKVS
jgi:hypothetical protein